MRCFGLYLLTFSVMLLTGCADNQNDRVDCNRINWYRLGYKDGSHGNYRQNLANAFPNCGANIIADKEQYRAGWTLGVKTYCTPTNAFQLGKSGKMYNNVCPPNKISAFDKAWRTGLRKFCTPHQGYMLGLDGKEFPGFCAPDLNPAFHRAYNRGAQHYHQLSAVKRKLDNATAELALVEQQYNHAHHQLHTMRLQYSQQSFSPQTQYQLRKLTLKVNRLAEKKTVLKAEQQKYQVRYDALRKAFLAMD